MYGLACKVLGGIVLLTVETQARRQCWEATSTAGRCCSEENDRAVRGKKTREAFKVENPATPCRNPSHRIDHTGCVTPDERRQQCLCWCLILWVHAALCLATTRAARHNVGVCHCIPATPTAHTHNGSTRHDANTRTNASKKHHKRLPQPPTELRHGAAHNDAKRQRSTKLVVVQEFLLLQVSAHHVGCRTDEQHKPKNNNSLLNNTPGAQQPGAAARPRPHWRKAG